mmetsp:Transcript_48443/g.149794  ORF Transcript_48443/g.149794 Transcript_48443/m.149794 type:complete len:307 (+) Transcript_48443:731-1651(+)
MAAARFAGRLWRRAWLALRWQVGCIGCLFAGPARHLRHGRPGPHPQPCHRRGAHAAGAAPLPAVLALLEPDGRLRRLHGRARRVEGGTGPCELPGRRPCAGRDAAATGPQPLLPGALALRHARGTFGRPQSAAGLDHRRRGAGDAPFSRARAPCHAAASRLGRAAVPGLGAARAGAGGLLRRPPPRTRPRGRAARAGRLGRRRGDTLPAVGPLLRRVLRSLGRDPGWHERRAGAAVATLPGLPRGPVAGAVPSQRPHCPGFDSSARCGGARRGPPEGAPRLRDSAAHLPAVHRQPLWDVGCLDRCL